MVQGKLVVNVNDFNEYLRPVIDNFQHNGALYNQIQEDEQKICMYHCVLLILR